MDQPTAPPKSSTSKQSTAYINNFRSSLTALVILHHVATTYGGEGSGVYQSSFHPVGSSAALIGFNAVNQSYFMGTFMFLAGHFSKKALQRKSKTQFIRDRLYRLALPSLGYTLMGTPVCIAIHKVWRGEPVGWSFLIEYWRGIRKLTGPVWFTGTLFCFDLCLVGYQKTQQLFGVPSETEGRRSTMTGSGTKPKQCLAGPGLFASLAVCCASDFFVRIFSPCGRTDNPLSLQPAYASQYVASYIFGICVDDVQAAFSYSPGTLWTLRAVSTATTYHLFRGMLSDRTRDMFGGWNGMSAAYAIWNNVFGYLLGSKLLQLFAQRSNKSWDWINQAAFPAFLLHMPVLTLVGVITDRWRGNPVVKTGVVGSVTVVLSWVAGYAGQSVWNRTATFPRPSNKKIE